MLTAEAAMRWWALILLWGCSKPSNDTAVEGDTDTDADSDADSDTDADTDTDTDVDLCAPLPAPDGDVIEVSPEMTDIPSQVYSAASGTTVVFAAGTYHLAGESLHIVNSGVTLRGEGAILDGDNTGGSIIEIEADDVTITELTLQNSWFHAIHVAGSDSSDTTGVRIHLVQVLDPGQQGIKINTDTSGTHFADTGEISCSTLLMTEVGREKVRDNCYTGGIDAHRARDWKIHDNHIEGFWCQDGLSEHGIHLWNGSRDPVIERNVLVDDARGIGLGLGQTGDWRTYSDDPCRGAAGAYGGTIRNNMIRASDPALFASASGFDSGIGLEQACDASVVHNTVYSTEAPFSSIEWRWERTSAFIANNLTTHPMQERDGAVRTGAGDIETATDADFVDAASGDLHLAPTSTAIDAGKGLRTGLCPSDFDREPRGSKPDVGADEVLQ
jgi:hypothetical protein